MAYYAYQETYQSGWSIYSASLNFIDSYEKEEMEHSDIIETCPSETEYDASQKCIGEIEEMDLFDLKAYIRSNIEIKKSLNNKAYMRSNIEIKKSLNQVLSSGCFSEMLYRVNFSLVRTVEETEEQLRERIKFTIYMLLLAILLGNNNECKFLATPDRLNISCITEYLLGNDGAHSYNGNGNWLITRRRYTRFTDEELDEIQPANLPFDVLQRKPTDKEIARMSGKIGRNYRRLAYLLGLNRVQLDHLIEDCKFTVHRIERMLFIWRDDIEGNATFEILINALDEVGINPDIVCQSLDRA